MALLEWTETYSVGVSSINEQHKRLIALINQLHEAMSAGAGKEMMGNVLRELVDYTVYHFGTEEKLFTEHAYPQFAAHLAEHEKFKQTIEILQREYAANRLGISIDTMKFLKEWLNDHILKVDKLAGAYLQTRGVM
jgi:hemerythrin-like metal-binding protein